MNVQNEDNGVNRDYPVKTLRVFGGLQICIGVLCAILSIVVLIIDSVALSKNCYIENNGNYFFDKECEHNSLTAQSVFLFDILFCLSSGWFILTGCFPFCMTQRRQSRWRCLKKTFMVCNIVAASLFVPTVLSLGVFGTIARANPEEHRIDVVVLSSFIAVLGIIELVISIAAASFCCCCTLWDDTDRSVVYITSGQPTHIVGMPDSHIIQSGPGQDGSAMRCGIYPAGDMTQQFQVPKPHFAEAELGQQFNRQTLPPYKI